jgi:hypothetical protein
MKTKVKQILFLIAMVQTTACSLFESQLSNAKVSGHGSVNIREEQY